MNRNKVYAKSKENQIIIKALNMYGRVPETWELLEEIERLNNIINELEKWLVEWREMLDCPDFYEEGIIDCINDTLTKLQELKGNNNGVWVNNLLEVIKENNIEFGSEKE